MKRLMQTKLNPAGISMSCAQDWEQDGWIGSPIRQSDDYIDYWIISDDNILNNEKLRESNV